jgi:hypothetical protein
MRSVEDRAGRWRRRQRYLGFALLGVSGLSGLGAWVASRAATDAWSTGLTAAAFGAGVFGLGALLMLSPPPRPGEPPIQGPWPP